MRTARIAAAAALVLSIAGILPAAGIAQADTGRTTSHSVTAQAANVADSGLVYRSVAPTRIVDTRNGTGVRYGHLPSGETLTVRAPQGASAVVLNVATVNIGMDTFLTVYPGGTKRPTVSNLNNAYFGATVSNQVVVPVGPDGTVAFYSQGAGKVDLIVDLIGSYAKGPQAGGEHQGAAQQTRVLDTRNGTGAPVGQVGQRGSVKFKVAGLGGVPADAKDIVLNVTVADNFYATYVTADPDGNPPSFASLNARFSAATAQQVNAKIDDQGYVTLYNHTGSVDLIADVQGYYSSGAGSSFVPTTPTRLLDTRDSGAGIGPAKSLRLKVTGSAGVPEGTRSVLVNLTALPGGNGFLTAYAAGSTRPNTSTVNFDWSGTTANLAWVPVSADGSIEIYNHSGSSTGLLVDVQGYLAG
ncbi:hypothetical protein GCM10009760_04510 [Kitasatospora kazusensis]|uniref:Uncharacterized protein n=1 Tax=Kitasatospora kazusensis TaxID=407974 RepID=A0ABP5KE01_9ACTN